VKSGRRSRSANTRRGTRTRTCPATARSLVTVFGKPFSSGNSFGNWFAKRVAEAGLPDVCMPHGLRKVGAVRAAENGATEQQMMAIFGWDSPKLAAHYAKKANQKKLAGAAMHKLIAS
jgi:hypothetical protein